MDLYSDDNFEKLWREQKYYEYFMVATIGADSGNEFCISRLVDAFHEDDDMVKYFTRYQHTFRERIKNPMNGYSNIWLAIYFAANNWNPFKTAEYFENAVGSGIVRGIILDLVQKIFDKYCISKNPITMFITSVNKNNNSVTRHYIELFFSTELEKSSYIMMEDFISVFLTVDLEKIYGQKDNIPIGIYYIQKMWKEKMELIDKNQ